MQEAAYGATLLLLLLNGARESETKIQELMAHFINCSSCGKQYNKQAFDKCPHCGFDPNPASSTVICPNKLCGKEISDQFEKCPFCGTPLQDVKTDKEENTPNRQTVKYVERSGWHTYATIMLVLSSIGLLILAILSLSEENAIYFIIGLSEFILFSLFCGIVQLLAGIKQGIDNLQIK